MFILEQVQFTVEIPFQMRSENFLILEIILWKVAHTIKGSNLRERGFWFMQFFENDFCFMKANIIEC